MNYYMKRILFLHTMYAVVKLSNLEEIITPMNLRRQYDGKSPYADEHPPPQHSAFGGGSRPDPDHYGRPNPFGEMDGPDGPGGPGGPGEPGGPGGPGGSGGPGKPVPGTSNAKGTGAQAEQHRFTTRSTTLKRFARTTPLRVSFEENCDYIAYYCLKAYTTGQVCGRTLYYTYHTFKNYCLLDYVNCMERYEVWQVVHMGECYNVTELTEYLLYPYDDDYFLDQYYVVEDH